MKKADEQIELEALKVGAAGDLAVTARDFGFNRKEQGVLQRLNRREFIGTTAAASLAALLAKAPTLRGAAAVTPLSVPKKGAATADRVIVIWMAGGMASTETFDPKRYTAFAEGVPLNDVLSTFPAIDTAVDNIKFSQGLEQIASVIDRGTVIRSFVGGDLGFILHSRHQYHWHTGYIPPQPMAVPHIGSVIARTLGPLNPDVPPFISIGQPVDGAGEIGTLKAFHTAGFLGTEFGPFIIPDPAVAAQAIKPPKDLGDLRFQSRRSLFQKLVQKEPVYNYAADFQRESLLNSLEASHRLLSSPSAKAFDLSLEPRESRDRYVNPIELRSAQNFPAGTNQRFAECCILARRLAEAGARYVEITSQYIPFVFWDTHQQGHVNAESLKAAVDRPVAQLIRDLEAKGLLERTLVVLASEFSRDAVTEGKPGKEVKDQAQNVPPDGKLHDMTQYGMHRHFTNAGSTLMFGGGVKRGFVYGKTADERPCSTIEDPMHVEDLHATMYHALGIAPDLSYVYEKRPVYVTKDGKGQVAKKIFQA